jgi:hypothetical protein
VRVSSILLIRVRQTQLEPVSGFRECHQENRYVTHHNMCAQVVSTRYMRGKFIHRSAKERRRMHL